VRLGCDGAKHIQHPAKGTTHLKRVEVSVTVDDYNKGGRVRGRPYTQNRWLNAIHAQEKVTGRKARDWLPVAIDDNDIDSGRLSFRRRQAGQSEDNSKYPD
jgi:hypothetical protein